MSSFGFMTLIMLALYAMPSLIAIKRKHSYRIAICVANVLGLFIGIFGMVIGGFLPGLLIWMGLLVWSFMDPARTRQSEQGPAPVSRSLSVSDELAKLHELKVQGAISEAEYEAKKTQMLASI